ncbi:hypothetical protein KIN20_015192 [Parelaphostrongylus tenuis]|uniref:Uncharacterized protein n=1 Tax=Parelaphostrongylus tenuis TaxID=148309 RepID=A0AAD5N3Y9_PARTN|nr:hypothetical protein KIN20_015192 [Parelaphostrongylus tenuis]
MDTSKTTSSADLDFTELFSCFDGAQSYFEELAAIEKRLSEMNAATEMWKVQCEDQQRRINELENEVIIRKNEGRG